MKPAAQAKPKQAVPAKHVAQPPPKKGVKKPVQQQQQQQHPQPQQQQPKKEIVVAEPAFAISKTIKLPQMLAIIDEDKKNDKTSFIIDTTGNAYTFFKYKGRIIDISEMIISEATAGRKHEENVENARQQFVHGLKTGDNLVLSIDIKTTNLNEFFKSKWFQPKVIFQYSSLFKKEYYKKDLITPEEDVDYQGNKGWYEPKEDQFQLVLLTHCAEDANFDPNQFLKELGLSDLKQLFNATKITG